MIDNKGHFFHIDFGHFLGNFKSKFGVKRERTPFVFTPEMAEVCKIAFAKALKEGKNIGSTRLRSRPLSTFDALCVKAFLILRQNSHCLITLFKLMIPAAMPELLKSEDIMYMQKHLHLSMSVEEAADKFSLEIEHCLHDRSRRMDNMLHNIKHH
jgi:phosphatidylinositol-4,5-bisphosphate 3-kinase